MIPVPARPYRRLTGRYRGWLQSGSLWIASDHLLSVKSDRFHEYYKRFYFRDIQALVVTRCQRWRFSTTACGIAILAIVALISCKTSWPRLLPLAGGASVALAVGWIYLAAAQSCITRVYTAVSSEELPSVGRRRTARRVLAAIDPLIVEAQRDLPVSPAGEPDAQDPTLQTGPLPDFSAPAFVTRLETHHQSTGVRRTTASDLFLASLFLYAAAIALELRLLPGSLNWLPHIFALLSMASAIWVLVERYRGLVRKSIQRVALVSLIVTGLYYYAQEMIAGLATGFTRTQVDPSVLRKASVWTSVRMVHLVACVVLGIVGAIVSFRRDRSEPL